jgi:hypothetical protein
MPDIRLAARQYRVKGHRWAEALRVGRGTSGRSSCEPTELCGAFPRSVSIRPFERARGRTTTAVCKAWWNAHRAPASLWWPSSESDGALPEGGRAVRQACAVAGRLFGGGGSVSMLAPSAQSRGPEGHMRFTREVALRRLGRLSGSSRRGRAPRSAGAANGQFRWRIGDAWPGVRLAALCTHGEGCGDVCRAREG